MGEISMYVISDQLLKSIFKLFLKLGTLRMMKVSWFWNDNTVHVSIDYMKAKSKQNLKNLWGDSLNPSTTWWKANIKLRFCCRLVCSWKFYLFLFFNLFLYVVLFWHFIVFFHFGFEIEGKTLLGSLSFVSLL